MVWHQQQQLGRRRRQTRREQQKVQGQLKQEQQVMLLVEAAAALGSRGLNQLWRMDRYAGDRYNVRSMYTVASYGVLQQHDLGAHFKQWGKALLQSRKSTRFHLQLAWVAGKGDHMNTFSVRIAASLACPVVPVQKHRS